MLGSSEAMNRQLYARKKRRVADLLRSLGHLDLDGKSVLDAGCGVGIVSELFFALGAKVSGIDASPIAISEAKDRAGPPHSVSGTFATGSLVNFDLEARFDFTFCLDVLYHIMDDENWALALRNLSKHTKDDGYLVIIDQLQTEASQPAPHVRLRSKGMYDTCFSSIGGHEVSNVGNGFLVYRFREDSK